MMRSITSNVNEIFRLIISSSLTICLLPKSSVACLVVTIKNMKQIFKPLIIVLVAFSITYEMKGQQKDKPSIDGVKKSSSQADVIHSREIKKKQMQEPYEKINTIDSMNVNKQKAPGRKKGKKNC